MRTTIDLPDSLVERTKISAAKRKTSMKELVIQGLETILAEDEPASSAASALARLKSGYALGGTTLSREESHAR